MTQQGHIFVLVHGAWWGGDWWWRGVTEVLEEDGHRVYTPALTALASRSHLLSPDVNLTTHIEDVANLILWEGLNDIILVGHSYGGMVISGVAERLPEGTIRSIVYLDAFLPEDGQSLSEIAANAKDVLGEEDPVPPPIFFAGDAKDLEAVLIKGGKPHPRACFFEPVRLTGARERVAIKTYIFATRNPQVFGRFAERVRSDPSWRLEDLPCGHMTMIEMPKETAGILLRAIR